MALLEGRIRAVKPLEQTYPMAESHGLYLGVAPRCGKYWRIASASSR